MPPLHPLGFEKEPQQLSELPLLPETLAYLRSQLVEPLPTGCDMDFLVNNPTHALFKQILTYHIRLMVDEALTADLANQPAKTIVCVLQDITHRKQAEMLTESYYAELLESRAQLEAQSRMLTVQTEALQAANLHIQQVSEQKMGFMTQMSHEIRTPLNGLIGLTAMLLDSHLNTDQLDLAESIKRASKTLLNTVNQLLDFSRIEAGFFTLNRGPCDLRQVMEQACDLVSPLTQQKNLELVTFIDPKLPSLIEADAEKLQQVVINLLSNACKYSNHGGVQLHASANILTSGYADITVSIKDSGIGIAAEKQHLLFKHFTQLHQSSDIDTPTQSTGLGLVICKSIIDLMQGTIGVTSKLGEGATFWFRFHAKIKQPATTRFLPYRYVVYVDEKIDKHAYRQAVLEHCGLTVTTEPTVAGILRNPLVDAVIIAYPFDETHINSFNKILVEIQANGIPVFCMVNRRMCPTLPFPVTGLIYKPLNTDRVIGQLLNPIKPLNNALSHNQTSKQPDAIPECVVIPLPRLGHILVVEDNVINQKVVCKFLEHLQYRFDVAHNGQEALEAVKTKLYDAILMDCQMPEMDGYEATRIIREEMGLIHIPIIALTAHALSGERQKCLQAGMNDYLTKPIEKQHLANLLSNYIGQCV